MPEGSEPVHEIHEDADAALGTGLADRTGELALVVVAGLLFGPLLLILAIVISSVWRRRRR